MLETSSPSKHNAMLGTKIKHPKSTNFDAEDDWEKSTPKRRRLSPADDNDKTNDLTAYTNHTRRNTREVADSDGESDDDEITLAKEDHRTDLETALPPIKTDKQAIEDYEAGRAAQETEQAGQSGFGERLNQRKWIKGKSSIYVDAFNLALETVLEEESHLFNEAELTVFEDWRGLSYEAQYLYVRLFLRKTSTWHRVNRLGYHSDIADLENAIEDLQKFRELPDRTEEEVVNPGELELPPDTSLEESYTFADRSAESIRTLEEASSLLLLDELKAIAKDAKVQGKNKTQLLKALRNNSGKQTGLGFSSLKRSDTEDTTASWDSTVDGADSRESTPRRENRDAHYVSKILAETGPCIRLSQPALKLFQRVHLVFYRSTEWTEKSLTTIILARIARWNFPEYLVSRSANIFASRSLLLEFEASLRTQFRLDNILEFSGTPTKDGLQVILDIFEEVLPRWHILLKDEQRKEDSIYASGEGAYLRRLSPAWVYTRIVHKGAYVLGKFKHHKREHETLVELLNQRLFHTSRRGDWYQRKALLEEHYMHALNEAEGRSDEAQKRHYKRVALQTCEEGLEDPLVHLIYHYDLQKRVLKIEKQLKVAKRFQHDFGHVRLAKPAQRTFYGTQIVRSDRASQPSNTTSTDGRRGSNPLTRRSTKTIWLDPAAVAPKQPSPSSSPTKPQTPATETTCSVESMCLSHYRSLGYKGYHSEGGILRTLFAYLFADILFLYIPNVFQTEFQTCPLDLHTDAFYPSRISEINVRLNEISNGDAERILKSFWDRHWERRTCVVGLDWSFDVEDLLSIVRVFPGAALSAVCKVLAQEYAARGGGVPDLFLWREDEVGDAQVKDEVRAGIKKEEGGDDKGAMAKVKGEEDGERRMTGSGKGEVMFAEVKSENDRLSDTQRLWIDVLSCAGVKVELCNALAKDVIVVD